MKIVIMAMVTGIVLGVIMSMIKVGVDIEGVSIGLLTILTITTMVTVTFFTGKNRIAKFD